MWAIYGKRTLPVKMSDGKTAGPDARFAALDKTGCRVTKLADAALYDTKEEAQAVLDKVLASGKVPSGVQFELRPLG